MESSSTTSGVVRPLAVSFRYFPGTSSGKEGMKEEVVRLGVELSLSIAQSMFLLSDDIHTLLSFCFKLWYCLIPYRNPVLERLLRVIHYIYSKDIKPRRNGVHQDGGNSVHWELIRNTWKPFSDGIIVLHRLDMLLRCKDCSFSHKLLSSAIKLYKQQVLNKLEDRLRPAEDISEAHGFARERLESKLFDFWKSLFHEEAIPTVVRTRIFNDLFTPILSKPLHHAVHALPVSSPYILGKDFAMQELREEVVRLGVELSLSIAQSMFLLSDDIHTLLWFCFKLWRGILSYRSPVLDRLLLVIHYIYSKDIKPKNGVYRDGGQSVQWELIRNSWKDFADAIIVLHRLDMVLRRKDCSAANKLLSSAIKKYKQQVTKKLEDKLRPAEVVSEAHGFARETLESNIFDLWKSLFDEEGVPILVGTRILSDLFTPILGKPVHSEIQALPVSSPYILGKEFAMQEMKEEVVRLGVELSLFIAESMFLLCDDIRTLLWFCYKLWRGVVPYLSPVLAKLLCVIHYVYSKDIKPMNGVYQDGGKSVQWELIRNTWKYFSDGIIVLHRLHTLLRRKDSAAGYQLLLSSAIKKYNQEVLKKLEDKLRSAEDVSEAHGFARETLESNIFDLWKSLFDEEGVPNVVRTRILSDLFTPILGKPAHSEIQALPVSSPYILGKDFGMQEVKEMVVRLGVELSLFIAESMFLLCDDIRNMLRFCYVTWREAEIDVIGDSPGVERLLRVIHYVYIKDIKPKKGVYQNGDCNSAHWELILTTRGNFVAGFRGIDRLVLLLRAGGKCGREFISVEEEVKNIREKFLFVKAVSEANGFARDVMESNFLDLWKSLFDEDAKEATLTLKAIKNGIRRDLFLPLFNQAPPP